MAVLITDIDHKFLKEDGKGAASSGNELARSVWSGLNISGEPHARLGNHTNVSWHFDDFNPFRSADYEIIVDTACTVTVTPTGKLKLAVDASGADDQAGLQAINAAAGSGPMIQLTSGKEAAFEARCMIDQTAATNAFFGVAADGVSSYAVDVLFAADSASRGTHDMIGVSILNTDAGVADCVHATGASLTIAKESAKTIAADTWFNVGLRFDGSDLMFYIDGVQRGDKVALASLPTTVLAPTFEVKMEGAVAGNAYVDWYAIGQEV
ncbi:hypothetical protein [uncultured Mediterranean phage]|nr:hypothetical protein [uncultured Mediterranean phage]